MSQDHPFHEVTSHRHDGPRLGHAHPQSAASCDPLGHTHVFLGADHARNERRVWWVIALTAAMMVAEIIGGQILGSMALTADGWHMSTHAGAMLIAALAYRYARRQAGNPRFTFGTGKVGDLAAFASAVILGLIALIIAWESALRLAEPVAIAYDEAIAVAAIGLLVNLVSAWLLGADHGHDHSHDDDHGHADDHGPASAPLRASPATLEDDRTTPSDIPLATMAQIEADAAAPVPQSAVPDQPEAAVGHGRHVGHGGHGGHHAHHGGHHGGDSNLKAAYLHVLADALTSVLAILALLAGRLYGWNWLDPAMGVVGALVIARWSIGLVRQTALVLVDAADTAGALPATIRARVASEGERVTDLHVWQVGPGHHAAIIALSSVDPKPPSIYKARLAGLPGLSHLTVEVTPA
ncbi:CDF family Co(II)/Ni(II) efflux transporter DmeF [Xaviernesmea oryzae]|uniref:CDF family Co(II)/Ni(II) efflux transporter DmeF n=1 Tax=Xaviernesmea oryzae TaxID=464029 RepID=UPI0008AE56B5|nr:CDF family Co(II)/Ni(II) efflux transporter DmeF [Xaviernesmea oryzae]SEM19318.1 cation diffusion facilitator family transporter [Xaviernesmea oryzae]